MRKLIHEIAGITLVFLVVALYCAVVDAQPVPDPAQSADQIFNTPAGNYVRVIGARVPGGAPILPSPVGDAVSVPSLAGATCNVVLDAIPVEHESAPGGFVPAVPELAYAFGEISWPVKIAGSEGAGGNWYWNVLLAGGACATAADSTSYVASSMAELTPLVGQPPWKCRLLRSMVTEMRVIDEIEQEVTIMVTACDPRVVPAMSRIFVPHAWAGRWGDLNFRGYSNGALEDRGRPGGK